MSENQRYRVIKRLASGGMAEVVVAENAGIEGFKKQVAIKRVLPQLSKNEQFIAMFLDEARLSAHLSHSNVVSVFDIGVGDDAYFIVMEYVDGAPTGVGTTGLNRRADETASFIAARCVRGSATPTSRTASPPLIHRDITPPTCSSPASGR